MRKPFKLLGAPTVVALVAFAVNACGDDKTSQRCVAALSPNAVVPFENDQRPALGIEVDAPAFGPCVQRVSDHEGHHEPMAVHVGARAQAFNADGTVVLLRNGQVLRLSDRKLVGQMPVADSTWVWSNDVPTQALAIVGNTIVAFDFASNAQSIAQTFPRYERLLSESGLWLPSIDGSWALGGQLGAVGDQEGGKELFIWNPKLSSSFPPLQVAADSVGHVPSPRWLQASPDGKGLVVAWATDGLNKPFSGIELYDGQGIRLRQLRPSLEACDLALDSKSDAWIVCAQAPGSGDSLIQITKDALTLQTDRQQVLLQVSVEHNVELSCVARGTDTCALSAVGARAEVPFSGEVAAFSLYSRPELPRLWRLAHHNSSTSAITSRSQQACPLEPSAVLPHATLDRSGKRVLFGSNWATNCFAELYLVDFR